MITLKQVTINKYKCIETEQSFDVEDDITVLVGKNESGKTAILEAITKSNSYVDTAQEYDPIRDYPRQVQQEFRRSEGDVNVVRSILNLPKDFVEAMKLETGQSLFTCSELVQSRFYREQSTTYEQVDVNVPDFLDFRFEKYHVEDENLRSMIGRGMSYAEFMALFDGYAEEGEPANALLDEFNNYFHEEVISDDSVTRYIVQEYIHPAMPKYLYYDEYHQLPVEIDLRELRSGNLDRKDLKTARALVELADLDVSSLLDEDYETYKLTVEYAGQQVTSKLRQYWETNPNLHVEFEVPRQPNVHGNPVLKIRVRSDDGGMTLPLESHSRGFRWFFSFFVWFSKIQEDSDNQYILLLDEPGLNLHASAQANLLDFIEDLAKDYQVIYTTHSPFMIDSQKLHRVRTVAKKVRGTQISDRINERDPDTLFPLQAALGYDIAQNLYIGSNNLLVEGMSDELYLKVVSSILRGSGRTCLRDDIRIVPAQGIGKVRTFISFFYGQRLNFACLLDTVTDKTGKQQISKLAKDGMISEEKILYFSKFVAIEGNDADIEDMFNTREYIQLFNSAFTEYDDICENDLGTNGDRIVKQIARKIGKKKFDHYRPAKALSQLSVDDDFLSEATLARFEKIFEDLNSLFDE